jgi:endonuclease/exonuclease/phosphatase family metal-dependent hydrolase
MSRLPGLGRGAQRRSIVAPVRRRRRSKRRLSLLVWLAAALFAASVALHEQPAPGQPQSQPQSASPAARTSLPPRDSGAPKARREPAAKLPSDSPFFSPAACEAHLRARPRKRARGPRIGTWNVRWFPDGVAKARPDRGTDVDWLACAIAALDVDVLAVQEFKQDVRGRAALLDLRRRLDELTSGRWLDALDECPGSGFQHLGFLFDSSRVELHGARALAELNPGRSACDKSLRPGFGAYARFRGGPDLSLVTVHLDSGVEQRDYDNRRASIAALARVVPAFAREHRDDDFLLLGDLNSMGCARCVPEVTAGEELARLDAQLAPLALARLPLPEGQACTHYYRGKAGALDHIVARAGMRALGERARVEVHGPCRDLACGASPRGDRVAAWQALSDHCPVVVELTAEDAD